MTRLNFEKIKHPMENQTIQIVEIHFSGIRSLISLIGRFLHEK